MTPTLPQPYGGLRAGDGAAAQDDDQGGLLGVRSVRFFLPQYCMYCKCTRNVDLNKDWVQAAGSAAAAGAAVGCEDAAGYGTGAGQQQGDSLYDTLRPCQVLT